MLSANVRETGAVGDGATLDTEALQRAVDTCAAAGGGTVFVPAGVYRCGTIRFASRVTLHLANGARLLASKDPQHYATTRGALLLAEDAESIAIEGMGVIDGDTHEDLAREVPREQRPAFRSRLLIFNRCRRVQLRQVRFEHGDSWTVHLKQCEDVLVDGITILNNIFRINSDGIDPDSCRNVRIANCHIVAGDDCIVLKSTEAHPCENVVVTNCTLASGATAIKLGTESHGDFRNVHVANCTIDEGMSGLGIFAKDGATFERITFSNITMSDMRRGVIPHRATPIVIELDRRRADAKLGRVRDVVLENILIESAYPSLIQGTPEQPLENFALRHITQRVPAWADFSARPRTVAMSQMRESPEPGYAHDPAYMVLAHVDGLSVQRLRTHISDAAWSAGPRAALALHHVRGAAIEGVVRHPAPHGRTAPAVIRDRVEDDESETGEAAGSGHRHR